MAKVQTIEKTRKRFKAEGCLSAMLFWLCGIWLAARYLIIYTSQEPVEYSTGSWVLLWVGVVLAVLWQLSVKIAIWWHHE